MFNFIVRILKKMPGIFFLVAFICYIILAFTDLREYPFIAFFACLFTGGIAYFLLRQPKNAVSNEDTPCLRHKIIKAIAILWTIYCVNGILHYYKSYQFFDYIAISLFVSIPYIIMWKLYKKSSTQQSTEKTEITDSTTDTFATTYVEAPNMIYKADGKPISDEEVPYLIEIVKQQALDIHEQSPNPVFHRTEREEELSVQFMLNHGDEIDMHTDSFEELRRSAYNETDLDTKIELLQETIAVYEKEKKWFYRTKGGTIYFQDFYECQHNSQNAVFSYIDLLEDELEYYIEKRDYIIPQILQVISSQNGILQKDIYQHIPDEPKSEIQKIIRELESDNKITRTKKGSTYFLTLT